MTITRNESRKVMIRILEQRTWASYLTWMDAKTLDERHQSDATRQARELALTKHMADLTALEDYIG